METFKNLVVLQDWGTIYNWSTFILFTSIYQAGTEIKGISDTIAMIVDTIHIQYQQIKMKVKDPNYKETLVTNAHRETLDTRVSMEVIVTS